MAPADPPAWGPTATPGALRARARLYQRIREFFLQRAVLEVQTPVLARHGVTEPHIHCIPVPGHGWLQPSPEYHMKRLLAAGSGPIYQITPVFREGENGRRHNPEFTMLEWYRPGFSLEELVDEAVELVQPVLAPRRIVRTTFRHAFREHAGLDPLRAPETELAARVREQGVHTDDLSRPELVDCLMALVVEPALPRDQLVVITDFPGWCPALAQTREDEDGETVAQRFELYFAGLELANGYRELTDAAEQQRRFEQDRRQRAQAGAPDMDPDPALLAALQAGLPECAGVAVGLERVLMAQLGAESIQEVLAFPAG